MSLAQILLATTLSIILLTGMLSIYALLAAARLADEQAARVRITSRRNRASRN